MSIIKMLILLSWSCVAASLEQTSSEWGNKEYAKLAIEYHALASRSDYMVRASEKAVGLYNTVCAQWREKLGDRVSFEQYQPVAAEERPAPIIESGPTLQSRTADYLFYNKDQMSLLGVYVCLDTVVEKLVDENVTALKNELMQVWSDSEDLLECIQQFQRDIDFSFSDQLACACAHVKSAGGAFMSRLQMADRGLYDFLCRGESVYVERLATSLSFFQPFFRIIFIDRDDSPLFYVINEARARYRELNDYTTTPATSLPGKIENTSELVRKLTALKHSFDENKQDVELVTLYTGCDIEQFWAEVLRYVLHHGEKMTATPKSRADLVGFLESVGVAPSNIAEFCACVTGHGAAEAGSFKDVDKTATYYKFATGQEIGRFLNLLLNCACLCAKNGEDHILQYMNLLQIQGGVNWWNVLSGLLESGCQYGQKGDQYLDTAWGKLMSDRFDLVGVYQHLVDMRTQLYSLPQSQDRLAKIVTNRLNRRLGIGKIWDQDRGMKWLFGKINGALHALQGYSAPGIRIEGVDVVNVGRMLSIMESMMQEPDLDFLQLIVKCLPEAPGCIRGVEALEEGSLYRGLLEGRRIVEFLMSIMSYKDKSRQKACNVLTAYLQNLGFKILSSNALESAAAVISEHAPQASGQHAQTQINLEQVWDMIQESEQWLARDENPREVIYRYHPDGRLYFSWESAREASHRASQVGASQKFGRKMTLLAE